MKLFQQYFQLVTNGAALGCGAASCGISGLHLLFAIGFAFFLGCGLHGTRVHTQDPALEPEGSCAWFGDAGGDVLYFGISAFWDAYRSGPGGADPRALLERSGPAHLGRFDLRKRTLMPPLEIQPSGSSAGIWDVLAHPNGRVYFSSFFEGPGAVDPKTGRVERFEDVGRGLTELALGADGNWIGSRYGAREGESGSVVVFDPEGRIVSELPLPARPGERLAPKTPAWDPGRGAYWVTTDSLSEVGGADDAHPTLAIDAGGALAFRIDSPEIQFVRFDERGRGWLAAVEGARLALWLVPPAGPLEGLGAVREVLLDEGFAAGLDFVQDIQLADDGRAFVTRWSGVVHVVSPEGRARRVALPQEDGGLYHTAVAADGDVCATLCGDVSVVCASLAPSILR